MYTYQILLFARNDSHQVKLAYVEAVNYDQAEIAAYNDNPDWTLAAYDLPESHKQPVVAPQTNTPAEDFSRV